MVFANEENDLLSGVKQDLLPVTGSLGFEVVDHETSDAFDNASVTLKARDLRIRIVRERSQVFVDFGSVANPDLWFDSAVVFEWVGASRDGGFHDANLKSVLRGLGSFLRAFERELSSKFAKDVFSSTAQQLIALRNTRASQRLGF